MKSISICVGLAASLLPAVHCAPFILNDDRIRNLDVTPSLGRGYSIMTDSFLSSCLVGATATVPSYNYEYIFSDFIGVSNVAEQLAGDLSDSLAYPFLKRVFVDSSESSVESSTKQYIVSSMRVERYYSSIREEVSPLSESATNLLRRGDYTGFFMACGSNYIRSIRRAQEVTAIFMFSTTSVDAAQSFSQSLKTNSFEKEGEGTKKNAKSTAIQNSLQIKVMAFGLGLNVEGAGTLLAKTLSEYNDVMKFAFLAMTQSAGGSNDVGMVYGVEIVPWVDNVQFQVESSMNDISIEVPLSRSLLPRAYALNGTDAEFDNTMRTEYACRQDGYVMDKYGYCCENVAIYNVGLRIYSDESPETTICRPLRLLDKSIVKNNVSANAEFVSRLDAATSEKMISNSIMEKCLADLSEIPSSSDYQELQPQETAQYDSDMDGFTVLQLRMALDPFGDYSLLQHMAEEFDELMNQFFRPCLAALYGQTAGAPPGTETAYFMANPWYVHDECVQMACLAPGNRWDRNRGGCTPSLMAGSGPMGGTAYLEPDLYCAKDVNSGADVEECKYPFETQSTFVDDVQRCWSGMMTTQSGARPRLDYLMRYFCAPRIAGSSASTDLQTELAQNMTDCVPTK